MFVILHADSRFISYMRRRSGRKKSLMNLALSPNYQTSSKILSRSRFS